MWVPSRPKIAVTTMAALAVTGLLAAPAASATTAATMLATQATLATQTTTAARALGSFSSYRGRTPLGEIPPGTVLKSRTLSYHVAGIALPVRVVQLVYRSANALGRPVANVTSVLEPPVRPATPRAVSYQSFYE